MCVCLYLGNYIEDIYRTEGGQGGFITCVCEGHVGMCG